eukprot:5189606-Prymnesium_polylepis.1
MRESFAHFGGLEVTFSNHILGRAGRISGSGQTATGARRVRPAAHDGRPPRRCSNPHALTTQIPLTAQFRPMCIDPKIIPNHVCSGHTEQSTCITVPVVLGYVPKFVSRRIQSGELMVHER